MKNSIFKSPSILRYPIENCVSMIAIILEICIYLYEISQVGQVADKRIRKINQNAT